MTQPSEVMVASETRKGKSFVSYKKKLKMRENGKTKINGFLVTLLTVPPLYKNKIDELKHDSTNKNVRRNKAQELANKLANLPSPLHVKEIDEF